MEQQPQQTESESSSSSPPSSPVSPASPCPKNDPVRHFRLIGGNMNKNSYFHFQQEEQQEGEGVGEGEEDEAIIGEDDIDMIDDNSQEKVASLLKQWGSDIVNDDERKSARISVDEAWEQRNNNNNDNKEKEDFENENENEERINPRQQQQQKKDQLPFVFNPYRPQQGMGFKGTAMWTTLLSELERPKQQQQLLNTTNTKTKTKTTSSHFASSLSISTMLLNDPKMKQKIAQIFRVDEEYNKQINQELERQDELCRKVIHERLLVNNNNDEEEEQIQEE